MKGLTRNYDQIFFFFLVTRYFIFVLRTCETEEPYGLCQTLGRN